MILCIDSGNTRLKWGLREGEHWLSHDALPQADIGRLAELPARLAAPVRVMVANVAGPAVAAAIAAALAPWQERLHFVRTAARAGGVSNGYRDPARLGVDRWCALIGARRQTSAACLVVGAGTATTIDTLDAAGHFCGGLILPGFDLMRAALAGNTAGLPLASGRYEAWPRCTDDAIYSGCLEAQLGAIERAFGRIAMAPAARGLPQTLPQCLLFGGAAPLLTPHLAMPWRQVETLVLDGLYCLATEAAG